MTKTTLHIQRLLPWHHSAVEAMGAEWVKWVNPTPGPNPFPNQKIDIRIWTDDRDGGYISQGEYGGSQFVRDMLDRWRQTPWGECYELANEPPCNDGNALARLRDYSIGAMREASARGIRLCILNLPEGNPGADGGLQGEAARASERWKLQQLVPAVKLACELGHYVGMHCYWKPGVEGPLGRWHALGRIVWDVEQWRQMGVDVSRLKLLINETGIDGLVAGGARAGWQSLNPGGYVAEVVELERAARQYPWLQACMLFTSGFEPPWSDYDHPEALCAQLAPALRAVPQPPKEKEPVRDYHQSERHGYKPQWLILHDTEGPASAALAWWKDPNNPHKSSAHDLITSTGEVIRCVPYDKAAHHAGGGKWPGIPEGSIGGTGIINLVSIGVELEYPKAPASPPWPKVQLDAAVKHVRGLVQAFGIPRERVLRHADVDPKNRSDPRGLDWEVFMDQVFDTVKPPMAEEVRNEAWKALGIPYNPEAAFAKYARYHCLGVPMTPEFDFSINGTPYRGQGFAECVLYCKTGDWGNIEEVDW